MTSTLFEEVLQFDNRANPWGLYTQIQAEPVSLQRDGTYVIGGYDEVSRLLRDPRVSSDIGKGSPGTRVGLHSPAPGTSSSFPHRDNPDHNRLRGIAHRHFGPPECPAAVADMRSMVEQLVGDRIDRLRGRTEFDLVEEVSEPVPLTVVCHLLGIPVEDTALLEPLVERISAVPEFQVDPRDPTAAETRQRAQREITAYMGALIERLQREPGQDMLSKMIHDAGPGGPMTIPELLSTVTALFVGGHETTVNLISNAMLMLLRHPDQLALLRATPSLVDSAIEETLRIEPSVHLRPRVAVDDIEIAGQLIPAGSSIILLLGAANRDPDRFPAPDTYDITRPDNAHLSFSGGVHYCFGAALGRLEGQIALRQLVSRLVNPRLVQDPPPYRPNADLRGPSALRIVVDDVLPATGH